MNFRQIEEKLNKQDKVISILVENAKSQNDFNTNSSGAIQELIKLNQQLTERVVKLEERMKL